MKEVSEEIRAHPRSRGEHFFHSSSLNHLMGSSPLTRGAPSPITAGPVMSGLIPAHAGSTPARTPHWWRPRAHPRSRGEHTLLMPEQHTRWGSSPLTRGAPRKADTRDGSCPAHPRSRGEHASPFMQSRTARGSSPLTRGAQRQNSGFSTPPGLIPAHAGSTPSYGKAGPRPWAHPRSRGEHIRPAWKSGVPSGSSPLTRGAL